MTFRSNTKKTHQVAENNTVAAPKQRKKGDIFGLKDTLAARATKSVTQSTVHMIISQIKP